MINRRKFNQILRRLGLIPSLSEVNIFVMTLTTVILFITSVEMRSEILYLIYDEDSGPVYIVLFIYLIIGVFLSLFHSISKREKKLWEIRALKWFSVVTLAGVIISSTIYIYEQKQPTYLIFTIWNLIQVFCLLFLSGKKHIGEYVKLSEYNMTYLEVFFGILLVVLILYFKNQFNTHWSIAFSSVLMIWSIFYGYFMPRSELT